MGWRTVVVSNTSKLDYKMNYLVIRSAEETRRIFLDEISVLMIASTSVSLTAYLLCELSKRNIDIIFCDQKKMPDGIYLPLAGCHDASDKVRKQIKWKPETKDAVWKQIVIHKIQGQSAVAANLMECYSGQLEQYARDVEEGDSTNREGFAAKVYFNLIFGNGFSRRDDDDVVNSELNYGYAILLSDVARDVASNGYLNQFGIHHDNQFNSFNLSCDLMEPFRPFIDDAVYKMDHCKFEHDEKMQLVSLMSRKVLIDSREQYLTNAIAVYVKTVLDAITYDSPLSIKFPEYDMQIYETNSDV